MTIKLIISASCACLAIIFSNVNAVLVSVDQKTTGDDLIIQDMVDVLGWLDIKATTQPDTNCVTHTVAVQDLYFNCTSSEIGGLLYNELGGTANLVISNTQEPDQALSSNIGFGEYILSTTISSITDEARASGTGDLLQSALNRNEQLFTWAVSSTSDHVVPVLLAAWLLYPGFPCWFNRSSKKDIAVNIGDFYFEGLKGVRG